LTTAEVINSRYLLEENEIFRIVGGSGWFYFFR